MIQQRPMRILTCFFAMAGLAATCQLAEAQLPTTVQLPSFSSFSYRGTVVVPDNGGAYLGGVNRSATGLNRRGLSRGFGSSLGHSGASVHATIIDHSEIDRQLLGVDPKELVKGKSTRKKADPDAEGKALVRYARQMYREGKEGQSFDTYRMAIKVLRPGLREFATREFERVFGEPAKQAVRMASMRR